MSQGSFDPGSFRDRDSRVFHRGGKVYRALSREGLAHWEEATATGLMPGLMRQGKVVRTTRLPEGSVVGPKGDWVAYLEHESIPFISYAYEWCFSMLKDAALLHLDLLESALIDGFILKDASPFNVQWSGHQPIFVDVGSFQKCRAGSTWVGYRQFCQMFLYPLLLQAYKGTPFQPYLRAHLDGIPVQDLAGTLCLRDYLRPGVVTHVFLQRLLENRYERRAGDVGDDLRAAGFHSELIRTNVRALRRLIERLDGSPGRSAWGNYVQEHSYTERDQAGKAGFVSKVAGSRRWRLVWDLGSNVGVYSRIAAQHADYLVAMDLDPHVVEQLYRQARREGSRSMLPLVVNLSNPSPGLGWRGRERRTLWDRGAPDLTLCLALIHHLVIAGNTPMREVVDWLGSLGTSLIIEFVRKEDPMVQRLLRNKTDQYWDYEEGHFERCLAESFEIAERRALESGHRTLYYARPRSTTPSGGA